MNKLCLTLTQNVLVTFPDGESAYPQDADFCWMLDSKKVIVCIAFDPKSPPKNIYSLQTSQNIPLRVSCMGSQIDLILDDAWCGAGKLGPEIRTLQMKGADQKQDELVLSLLRSHVPHLV